MFNRDWRPDKVALGLKPGNPNALDVDVGDDGTVDFSSNRSTFRAINVQGGAGDDAIRIDESGGTFSDDPVTLDGGPGNDTLTGRSAADIIDRGGDDVRRGGDGDDVLNGGSGQDQVDGGRGEDNASLGTGDVRFTWDPGDGTGGAESITVNDLTGTGLQDAAIDLGATPGGAADGQPDTMIANGTDHADHVRVSSTTTGNVLISGPAPQIQIPGSEPANDTLNTLAGDDTASVASGVSGVIQPIIYLGTDE